MHEVGKGKVFSPLNYHHAMKTCGGVEVLLHPFLSSTLVGGELRGTGKAAVVLV
jgi:hypothetical protein